jgi:hypothetical protein
MVWTTGLNTLDVFPVPIELGARGARAQPVQPQAEVNRASLANVQLTLRIDGHAHDLGLVRVVKFQNWAADRIALPLVTVLVASDHFHIPSRRHDTTWPWV